MASVPSFAEETQSAVVDYVKMYNIVMEFKDTLAKIFLEKGLVSESCQLADFKTVAVETQSGGTTHVQHLSDEVMCVFKLIAEVVYAVVMNRIKAQKAATIDKFSQTDVSASVAKSIPIKKEQHNHEQTHDDSNSKDTTPPSPTQTHTTTTTTTTTTPTTTNTHHPALRRSSRSSVLNRKPLTKTAPRTKATKNADRAIKSAAASNDCNRLAGSREEEEEDVKILGDGEGEKVERVTRAWTEGESYKGTADDRFQCRECGEEFRRLTAFRCHLQKCQATRQISRRSKTSPNTPKLQGQEHNRTWDSQHQETETRNSADDDDDDDIDDEEEGEMSDFEPVGYLEQGKQSLKEEDPQQTSSDFTESAATCVMSDRGGDAQAVKKEDEGQGQQQEVKGQRSPPPPPPSSSSSSSSSSTAAVEDAGSMGAMYKVTGSGLYRCTVCGQETKDRSNMRKHVLRWHAGEQRHRCGVCGKAFTFRDSLKFHMKVHVDPSSRAFERTPLGLYRCKQCGRECRNRSNIVKHVNRKHLKAGEKPHHCSLCGATFGYLRSLKRHELVHQGVRDYQCPQCDKRFVDPTALRTHSRVHTDDRPYACQLCGNRFRQKEGLKGHMRSHTGDKPYVCDRCGMAFAAKRSLTRHIRVHTGERPYSCDQCVAAFADWTTLHNHKLVHRDNINNNNTNTTTATTDQQLPISEQKPYQCQFCGIQYSDPLTLKRHLRVHSNTTAAAAAAAAKKTKNEPPSPKKARKAASDDGRRTETQGSNPAALHLQYRPYACELCGERFKHLRGYTTHRSKHLNGTLLLVKKKKKKKKKSNDDDEDAGSGRAKTEGGEEGLERWVGGGSSSQDKEGTRVVVQSGGVVRSGGGVVQSGGVLSGVLPSGGVRSGVLPSGGVPSGVLPSGGVGSRVLQSGVLQSGGVLSGVLPGGGVQSSVLVSSAVQSGVLQSGVLQNSSVNVHVPVFQSQLPLPPPPQMVNNNASSSFMQTTLNTFPTFPTTTTTTAATAVHTLHIPVRDDTRVVGGGGGDPRDLVHYASEGLTQIFQYEDGSLGHMTTLVPHPPPPPPPLPLPPPLSSFPPPNPPSSSSLLQPVEDLLGNVVTVVFEGADGNVVLQNR